MNATPLPPCQVSMSVFGWKLYCFYRPCLPFSSTYLPFTHLPNFVNVMYFKTRIYVIIQSLQITHILGHFPTKNRYLGKYLDFLLVWLMRTWQLLFYTDLLIKVSRKLLTWLQNLRIKGTLKYRQSIKYSLFLVLWPWLHYKLESKHKNKLWIALIILLLFSV